MTARYPIFSVNSMGEESMNLYEFLATCRAVVGYMGEKSQSDWWPSAFMTTGSKAFLSPAFPRTHFLSQCRGTAWAASNVHDEHIGIGHVYHLFRLPEDQEIGIQRVFLSDASTSSIAKHIADTQAAIQFLKSHSKVSPEIPSGPVRIANATEIRDNEIWSLVAGHYAAAFDKGHRAYPYFADRS